MDSKPKSLREQSGKSIAAQIRNELSKVLEAVKENQKEVQGCVHQIRHLLHLQRAPWTKSGAMLWGVVLGVLLYAFLQPRIEHSHDACALGSKIMATWTSLSESQKALIDEISRK
ncbi:MAG: hypothetical protein OXF06_00525 [Bacteroidetes bacterium]|nr:hypothetical protein [Bacteroidota bacterium]MCY4223295.1 hypothetical protein [Bacteroidota bacterium]